MKHTRVVRIVNVTEVKSKFGEIIERVYASNEDLIVERGGIPVVAIIPISVYQKNVGAPPDAAPDVVQRVATASERAESSQRLGELFKNVHAQMPKVDEEEAERLINAEVTRMRAARRKPMKARPTRAIAAPSQKITTLTLLFGDRKLENSAADAGRNETN